MLFVSVTFMSCYKVNSHTNVETLTRSGRTEEVVYMSDIDGLVTAVMLYGVTNGITYNGTNYVFVVEPEEN